MKVPASLASGGDRLRFLPCRSLYERSLIGMKGRRQWSFLVETTSSSRKLNCEGSRESCRLVSLRFLPILPRQARCSHPKKALFTTYSWSASVRALYPTSWRQRKRPVKMSNPSDGSVSCLLKCELGVKFGIRCCSPVSCDQ